MKFRLTLLVCFFSLIGFAQEDSDYKKEQFVSGTDTLNYRILFPKDFSETQKYPVVLVLHGAGERGDDNKSQLVHGGDLFLKDSVREQFPAIVIFPQAPKDDYWAKVEVNRDIKPFVFDFKNKAESTPSLKLVMELMEEMKQKSFVDDDRLYVGGLSMGGMGTFEIIFKKPELFAAAFAICGGANTEIAAEYPENFDIWIFHGEQDDVVLPKYSKAMARTINHHGGNAKLSLYPEDNHNSWDSAFAEPYLLKWLFSHSQNQTK